MEIVPVCPFNCKHPGYWNWLKVLLFVFRATSRKCENLIYSAVFYAESEYIKIGVAEGCGNLNTGKISSEYDERETF